MAELDELSNTDESNIYYKQLMDEYTRLSKTNSSQKDFMTKQWVDIIIQRILSAESVMLTSGYSMLNDSVKTALCTYLVDKTKEGKNTLVLKPVPGKEHRSKTIIPLEETYDIVREAHLSTKHGSSKEMEAWLASHNYSLSNICCAICIQCCVQCSLSETETTPLQRVPVKHDIPSITKSNEPTTPIPEKTANKLPMIIYDDTFQQVCTVEVLDMSKNPDQQYSFLMVYENIKTNFIQLRPMITNTETEMMAEIFKIFIDFGPPDCLVVDTDNIGIYYNILKKLGSLADFDIELAFYKSKYTLVQKVAQNILQWMKEHDCKNWGTGCHEVQWKLNNVQDMEGKTPFSRVFGNEHSATEFGYISKFMPSMVPVNDNSDDDDFLTSLSLNNDDEDDDDKPLDNPSSSNRDIGPIF